MRRPSSAKDKPLEAAQPQNERGEQADGSGAENSCLAWLPDFETALDLERLDDALLGHAQWFSDDGDVLQPIRNFDDVLRIIDVVLGEVAVAPTDATLEVDLVGCHVVRADLVVDARPAAANG